VTIRDSFILEATEFTVWEKQTESVLRTSWYRSFHTTARVVAGASRSDYLFQIVPTNFSQVKRSVIGALVIAHQ
jgi:hypothetical protein